MKAGGSLIGAVDRKHSSDFGDESCIDMPVEETGGELVASQSSTGCVHFIAYPRTSSRRKANKTDLILFGSDVTVHVIRKALRRYLLVLQDSSTIGADDALTLKERAVVIWVHFSDLRNRYEFLPLTSDDAE
jgi:hypothetical protein